MPAITVLGTRIAPVLNWSVRVLIVEKELPRREIVLNDGDAYALLRTLKEQGIVTLICGAATTDVLIYGEQLGLEILHGVAGEIEEVLAAHEDRCLDGSRFRLPGCRMRRCCRRSFDGKGQNPNSRRGKRHP